VATIIEEAEAMSSGTIKNVLVLVISLGVLGAVGTLTVYRIKSGPKLPLPPQRSAQLFTNDERLGWWHLPNVQVYETTPSWTVTMTTDMRGCRITPTPRNPLGDIIILGCSYTFLQSASAMQQGGRSRQRSDPQGETDYPSDLD